MRLDILGGVLAVAGTAAAFSDSTPFVLLSTTTFDNAPESNKIHTASLVQKFTRDVLATCPTDNYLFITQPGVSASDLRQQNGCTMPYLCEAVVDSRIQGRFSVPEVVGNIESKGIAALVRKACEDKSKTVQVKEVHLASASPDNKVRDLAENDVILSKDLDKTTASDSYTIVFLSTPAEPVYEAEFTEPLRMDLKRHVLRAEDKKPDNRTEWDMLPLFEKYQFFTPGVFMGIITALVLFSLLYAGLGALSSLQVSYGAFEKEMGPAAHKKQQ